MKPELFDFYVSVYKSLHGNRLVATEPYAKNIVHHGKWQHSNQLFVEVEIISFCITIEAKKNFFAHSQFFLLLDIIGELAFEDVTYCFLVVPLIYYTFYWRKYRPTQKII